MSRVYAGIGARSTPADVLDFMEVIADRLWGHGWTLRSGHAPGADQAFERGAGQSAEVFLPWPTFEHSEPLDVGTIYDRPGAEAYRIAEAHHPAWARLSRGARALHARNVHQILGAACDDPARFVLCWTPGARCVGGTGQAIRVAESYGVAVFNLALPEVTKRLLALPSPDEITTP